jgi:hypothetical protein
MTCDRLGMRLTPLHIPSSHLWRGDCHYATVLGKLRLRRVRIMIAETLFDDYDSEPMATIRNTI